MWMYQQKSSLYDMSKLDKELDEIIDERQQIFYQKRNNKN